MKVLNEIACDIRVSDMKDGQIGIITKWGGQESPIGRVVQRFYDSIITLGRDGNQSWQDICEEKGDDFEDCRVRILPKGTKLEI